jgi:hypothetical protein
MTGGTDLAAECRSAALTARLTGHVGGRPHLVVEGPDRLGWELEFDAAARLTDARGTNHALHFEIQPYPASSTGDHGALTLSIELELDADARATLRVDAPADYPLSELTSGVLRPLRTWPAAWDFIVPDGEGLRLRGDGTGPGWRPRLTFNDIRITLPASALIGAAGEAVVMTAVDGHDQAVDLLPREPGTNPGLGLVCLASLGTWRYSREWRIAVRPSGAVSAIAEEVSSELTRGGITLHPQSEKLAARQSPTRVRESILGTTVWCHFDTLTDRFITDLRAADLRAVRVMGRPADPAARTALAVSPYASGPYFQTYDVFPPGSVTELGWRGTYPPEGASDGWSDDLIRDMAGWLDPAWMYLPFPSGATFWSDEAYLEPDGTVGMRRRYRHDLTQVRSYRRCPSRHRHVIEEHGLPMLDAVGASAIFFDIATAMWGLECYSPEHTCTRSEDVAYRREALELLAATGRPLFSEAGKWWAIDLVNGFEGLFSYDQEMHEDCMQLTDYPEDRTRRAYEFDLEHRVPLFGMVARHAVTRTMWWGTGQDRHEATWASKDAIAALFGANPIFVVDPDHPLGPGTARWARFTRTATAFDTLADLTRDARVVSYESSGPSVGHTTFEGGTTVEANVCFAADAGLAAGEVVIRDPGGRTVATLNPHSER